MVRLQASGGHFRQQSHKSDKHTRYRSRYRLDSTFTKSMDGGDRIDTGYTKRSDAASVGVLMSERKWNMTTSLT